MTALPLPAGFEDRLRQLLGQAHVKSGDALDAIDPGWNRNNLKSGLLALPGSTEEVASLVRLCREAGVSIVPQGGRTGLVGGSVSAPGQLVVSTARLNAVERLDPIERTVTAGAGASLQSVQEAAAAHGLEPGIDLPSRGTATIGGMISTNAGGIMAFRNGVMRHRILGLEAVLPDGTVMSDCTRVVKTAAGYDLKHLVIGAEGTLGIVTRAVLKLDPLPQASATALFGLPSVEAVLEVIQLALALPGVTLRAAEAMWRPFLDLTAEALGWRSEAIDRSAPVYGLLSIGGAEDASLPAAFETLFETVLERFPQATGLIAQSSRQERELWRLREDTDLVYHAYPAAPSFDVSLPQSEIPAYLGRLLPELARIDGAFEPLIFGHLADGNLHIILNRPGPLEPDVAAKVETAVYRDIRERGGSFSAEHGVGSQRIGPLEATADPGKLALIRLVKASLDPHGTMNPGVIVRR
ncbi:FAD-binding oxidoreductase [Aureimonas sp. AU12]|uniref:FAD-binding oxidoreductase n=1 Tax=Aureimonas sp. AU12 TaxID=1638161 RepID=UPI0007823EF6|nr:FAD-binding oxidoreductase [Aureimonas sp. AU12]